MVCSFLSCVSCNLWADCCLDTLLDLHGKLSTVVRYYDRMLEERLSSAYTQHSLGYGPVPGGAQYPNIYPSMPGRGTDPKTGAENFYYGNQAVEKQPSGTPYAQQHRPEQGGPGRGGFQGDMKSSGVYPQQAPMSHNMDASNQSWNGGAYPVASPPSNTNPAYAGTPSAYPAHPGSTGPAQYYAPSTQGVPDPSVVQSPRSGETESRYPPSPVMRRDTQYQPGAPQIMSVPSAHEQSPVMENAPSLGYTKPPENNYVQPNGQPPLRRQPTEPPAQSYYSQQQPPQMTPVYPQATPTHLGGYAFPDAPQAPLQNPPPSRPAAEESLIEL